MPTTNNTQHVTPAEFRAFLRSGDRAVSYATGNLASAAEPEDAVELRELRSLVWAAAERGDVF